MIARNVPGNAAMADLYAGYEAWKGWSQPFVYDAEQAEYYRRECADLKVAHADVLDIGFGSGVFIAWARKQGARVAGTEINPVFLDAANKFGMELLPPEIETIAERNTARFDTIVAFDVFEHFPVAEVGVRLRAAETMLRPGGHILLRFPNAQSPFGLASQFGDPTHKVGLSCSAIEQLIQGSSLVVVRYGGAARVFGRGLGTKIARGARYLLQDALARTLNAIYAQSIPWNPVVTIVLRKRSGRQEAGDSSLRPHRPQNGGRTLERES